MNQNVPHYYSNQYAVLLAVILSLAIPGVTRAENWPGWRGPTGLGYSSEKDLPLTWDGKTGENILWKVPLYGHKRVNPEASSPGWSCPIVWRDRVIITAAEWPLELLKGGRKGEVARTDVARHHVLCYQVSDGKLLWDTLVPPGKCVVNGYYHDYAAPTPVTDGEHIFALFGSAVIVCLDFEGKVVWREDLPRERDVDYGVCSSLVLHDDSLISVGIAKTGLRSLYKKTGKLKWEKKYREKKYRKKTRFSTPTLVSVVGQIQLIHLTNGWVHGIDPDRGDLKWYCRTPVNQGSPAFGSGLLFVDPGAGSKVIGAAIDPSGEGDVSNAHIKWQVEKVPSAAGCSPIIVGDHVYRAGNPGILKCWKLADGKLVYTERLTRVSPCSSRIATADGRIYIFGSNRSYVIKAGPQMEVLASNDLDDGQGYTAPAVSNGRIFIKGKEFPVVHWQELSCDGNK